MVTLEPQAPDGLRGQDAISAWFLWAPFAGGAAGLTLTACSSWLLRTTGVSGCICAARTVARRAGQCSLWALLGGITIALIATWATTNPMPLGAAACGGLLGFTPSAVMMHWQLRRLLRTALARSTHPAGAAGPGPAQVLIPQGRSCRGAHTQPPHSSAPYASTRTGSAARPTRGR